MTTAEKISRLHEILEELEAYHRAIGKIEFDMECIAPPEGIEQAGADMAILGKHTFALTHSEEYISLITDLRGNDELDPIDLRLVERLCRSYEATKNVTPELNFEMESAGNKAYGDWLRAKEASDWSIFEPSFRKVVEYSRELARLQEHPAGNCAYDALLNLSEYGMLTEQLDPFFEALKARIVPLMREVVERGKPVREDFLTRSVPISVQEQMSHLLMEKEGLRKEALVLQTTEHPFTTSFGNHDVRVTTHYHENQFISNICTTLHEGGHAMVMQNEPEELFRHHAADGVSCGQHECISRFYENIIGRSEAFIHYIYPEIMKLTGDTFADVTEQELYEGMNLSRPSLIRTESDELTYCLHILIRYELEKDFMSGALDPADVPAAWNEKYREYLGVEVPDDAHGCLQDVHWAFVPTAGYFPSYALGNAYGAQILHTMEQDFDVFGSIREEGLGKVSRWLIDNVFSKMSMLDPDEWLVAVTGEHLNVNYFLDYLESKFRKIYQI